MRDDSGSDGSIASLIGNCIDISVRGEGVSGGQLLIVAHEPTVTPLYPLSYVDSTIE